MTIEDGAGATVRALDLAAAVRHPSHASTSTTSPFADGPLLTIGEASTLLGFRSRRTLEGLRLRGEDPASIKLPCGGVRYTRAALEDWLKRSEAERAKALCWRSHHQAKKRDQRKARDRARYLARKEAAQRGHSQ